MNPYQSMPPASFWSTGVAQQDPRTVQNLYKKKFTIAKTDRITTGGSCFAQHVSARLRQRGYRVLDVEPPPPGLLGATAKSFGYLTYSARYGNIYTVRQLLQLVEDARSGESRDEDVWEKNGRYYDALRPGIEPKGFGSPEEVIAHRQRHLSLVQFLLEQTDVFIFTLGLTEAWVRRETGTVYPTCPGTIAGEFDEQTYAFQNFGFSEILADLLRVRSVLKGMRPEMRFILTVSPVPLTATATGKHVLVATTFSKSVLRAVCGTAADEHDDIDYFPSYELVASSFSRGAFYDPNLRTVTADGVNSVMRVFLSEHQSEVEDKPPPPKVVPKPVANRSAEDLVCEEELLEAFRV